MPSTSIAEELAKKQREIAVSEFFERNKHILGFDSLTKALITSVKEAVDNSLDVTEECGILPDIVVDVQRVDKDEFRVAVEDNGPGIVKKEVANIFARLLYGSRFASRRQARGQQGLGISGVILYGQITTGKPAIIKTRTAEMDVAYQIQLMIDTHKNKPNIIKDDFTPWDKPHGTRVEVFVKGRYIGGKQSIPEYLKSVAIVNPHARITYNPPEGGQVVFERVTEELPPKTVDVPPHPYGLELGTLLQMCKETKSYRFSSFLSEEFDRISDRVAKEICELAGVDPAVKPRTISLEQAKAVLDAIKKVRIMAPRTECLSPIGERLIKKGLKNVLGSLRPEFFAPPLTRNPSVYSGNPFQVEVGIAFGGDIPPDRPVEVLRYANRVPLLYQGGACAVTQAVAHVDWRRYGLEQRGGEGVPFGPAIVLVHVASSKIPYTSEAKEAVATIPELMEEMELALKECGRRLKTHLNKKARKVKAREKFDIVQKVLPQIAAKSAKIVKRPVPNLDATITKIMGVVWVEDRVTFEKGRHFVEIDVHNFTATGKKLNLHCLLPRNGTEIAKSDPKPSEVREDGKVTWELKRIGSVEKATVRFEVKGLEQGDLDEVDLYVSGIPPDLVIGAEPLPGDWELNYKEFETEEAEAPPPAEEADEEVDYDEAEEVLEDE
jgi:DNA topoisomerase-6 subunit B